MEDGSASELDDLGADAGVEVALAGGDGMISSAEDDAVSENGAKTALADGANKGVSLGVDIDAAGGA